MEGITVIGVSMTAEDFRMMGHTSYQSDEGNTLCICCSGNTYRIERIFIRNFLQHLGYEIIKEEDQYCLYCGRQDTRCVHGDDILITTSMPWDKYKEMF